MNETVVYIPIRAYQEADEDGQYAVIEWLAKNDSSEPMLHLDLEPADESKSEAYFLDRDVDLIVDRNSEGNLIGRIVVNPDLIGEEETYTVPFVIRDKDQWPAHWVD